MKVCTTIADSRRALQGCTHPIGAILTMGALHEGHLALVRQARKECPTVVASIYVNPTQFGDQADLAIYPRNIQKDIRMLRDEGVDIVFTPIDSEMYPKEFGMWVEPGKVAGRLEGEHRPGHFRGVCTIVLKLFNTFHPDRSYFGQKDAQQLMVIRRMVEELALGIDIIAVPTVREHDGLALSSRNMNLSHAERQAAPVLYRALCLAKEFAMRGQGNTAHVREAMRECIAKEALATVDYVSIADAETLEELTAIDRPAVASLAVTIGTTRLIDNVLLAKAG
ncbi:MAG: pantoate--beta-alanine ligase [Chloroflexota bacterium]|nr:pantoate--beta-alanine ligase [Chloroflexota bacterium]